MKDYLELAQGFIDSNKTIPNEILQRMNTKERQLASKMIEIKGNLGEEIDRNLSDSILQLQKLPDQNRRNNKINFLYAAAAVFIALSYFPISQSIETKALLKEETSRFVEELFQENENSSILSDLSIEIDWLNNKIIPDV